MALFTGQSRYLVRCHGEDQSLSYERWHDKKRTENLEPEKNGEIKPTVLLGPKLFLETADEMSKVIKKKAILSNISLYTYCDCCVG